CLRPSSTLPVNPGSYDQETFGSWIECKGSGLSGQELLQVGIDPFECGGGVALQLLIGHAASASQVAQMLPGLLEPPLLADRPAQPRQLKDLLLSLHRFELGLRQLGSMLCVLEFGLGCFGFST